MTQVQPTSSDAKPGLWQRLKAFDYNEWVLGFDKFPSPITVNFNRKSSIPTAPGVILTMILYVTVALYAVQRAEKLVYRKGPTITPELSKNFFTSKDEINLDEAGWKLAFGVMDYTDRSVANSPDFVEWNVYLETRLNLAVTGSTQVPYHRCTAEDYESFFPIQSNNIDFYEELKRDLVLYCLDSTEPLVVRGADEIDSVALNFDYIACNKSESAKCRDNTLKDLQDYLGQPELIILSNNMRFDNSEYDSAQDIIKEYSFIWNQHIDKRQANWMQTYVTTETISDDISYLDIGFTKGREFFSFELGQLGLSYADSWENYYKVAGFTIFRNLDKTNISRSTYDVLNFLGDVGGLEGILTLFGGIVLGWYSSFASVSYFMSLLFHSRPDEPTEGADACPVTIEGLEMGRVYDKRQKAGMQETMIHEFMNRAKIQDPSTWWLFRNCLCCSKKWRKFKKYHSNATSRTERDFDLLDVIKKLRLFHVQLKSIMTRSQRKLSHQLASRAITDSESNETGDEQSKGQNIDGVVANDQSNFEYVRDVLADLDSNLMSRRFLMLYLEREARHQDQKPLVAASAKGITPKDKVKRNTAKVGDATKIGSPNDGDARLVDVENQETVRGAVINTSGAQSRRYGGESMVELRPELSKSFEVNAVSHKGKVKRLSSTVLSKEDDQLLEAIELQQIEEEMHDALGNLKKQMTGGTKNGEKNNQDEF